MASSLSLSLSGLARGDQSSWPIPHVAIASRGIVTRDPPASTRVSRPAARGRPTTRNATRGMQFSSLVIVRGGILDPSSPAIVVAQMLCALRGA